jgi:uncharacterized protein YkwD
MARFALSLLIIMALSTATTAQGAPDAHAVLSELNLARTNPKGYAAHLERFRRTFRGRSYLLEGSRMLVATKEGAKAVEEAISYLARLKPLPPLEWSEGLAAAASDLAKEQEKTGSTGHNPGSGNMRERIERHGQWSGRIGENIGYGPDDARGMVMQLIIDDGIPDRGHRKNIFDHAFKVVGVACGEHPFYRTLCAMDFAGTFEE